ncbi:NAD(P)/FAD-dependent oxidoreductase [Nocardioides sp.]|uniref:NAD(P)/FAD-dependent oxidoreductase n=1 Tax=Nocardioides sp. TaxID=35761 RepID=UPI0039E47537
MARVVVVGAGLAGLSVARALRSLDYDGEIVVVGDEPHRPYDRPPLSKEFLAGDESTLPLEPEGEDLDVTWLLGSPAASLSGTTVTLADGTALAADAVVVATGARARRGIPGDDLPHVHTLRTLDDARALRDALDRAAGQRVVIVGGGFIGSEVAAAAVSQGAEVTMVVPEHVPIARGMGELGAVVAAIQRGHGVDVVTDTSVTEIAADRVTLSDGRRLPADLVVVGIGAEPNTEWLAGSGLDVAGGIVADEHGATALPGVFAVGDVARWWSPALGRHHRHEHWTAAREQADVVAARLLGHEGRPPRPPYVWSDFYDHRALVAGHPELGTETRIEAGDPAEGHFCAVSYRDGEPVGVIAVDELRTFMSFRRRLRT